MKLKYYDHVIQKCYNCITAKDILSPILSILYYYKIKEIVNLALKD